MYVLYKFLEFRSYSTQNLRDGLTVRARIFTPSDVLRNRQMEDHPMDRGWS